MAATDYAKILSSTEPEYKGNIITNCCKDFLSRLLAKKVKKRLSIFEAVSHPWIIKSKPLINGIVEKYKNDPEKMIQELNNTTIDNNFFLPKVGKIPMLKTSENVLDTSDTQNKTMKMYLGHKIGRDKIIINNE